MTTKPTTMTTKPTTMTTKEMSNKYSEYTNLNPLSVEEALEIVRECEPRPELLIHENGAFTFVCNKNDDNGGAVTLKCE
jgi:hypothetical protein